MRFHIVTHEVTSYYTLIEADTEEEAKAIALKKGGVWLRNPAHIKHKIVRGSDDQTPHLGRDESQ